jgi:hypothetical protein
MASESGEAEVVKLLLAAGADASKRSNVRLHMR